MRTSKRSAGRPRLQSTKEPLRQAAKGKEGSSSTTFKTLEEAAHIVNPVVWTKVGSWVRRDFGNLVAPGNLKRLSQSLIREERGSFADTRTPLFRSLSFEQVAGKVLGLVRKNFKAVSKEYRSVPGFARVFYEVEETQSKKIGYRGHFPPASEWMKKPLDALFCDKPPRPNFNSKAWAMTMDWLSNLFQGHWTPVTEDSWKEGFQGFQSGQNTISPLNPDSTSAYPDYVRHWYHAIPRMGTALQQLCQKLIEMRTKALWRKFMRASSWKQCTLHLVGTCYQRTNVATGYEATPENTYKGQIMSKLRLVVGVDKRDTTIGKPILNRLIEACKTIKNPDGTRPFVALTTPQILSKTMQVALGTAKREGLTPLGTDFSHFDQSMAPWQALQVAQAVSKWMDIHSANIFVGLVYSEFYQCRGIAPFGVKEEGPSSMKSGTIFTNILDSLVNLASQKYGEFAGYYNKVLDHFVQGDDAIMIGVGVNPKSFSQCVDSLGWEGNEDKQYFEPGSVSFCQNLHVLGYPGGIYPIARATAAISSTEDDVTLETDKGSTDQFKYILAYRTVCRLASACFNPCFAEFVKMVADEDKLLHLGREMSASSLAKLAGSYSEKYERTMAQFPWKSLGSTKSGFEQMPVNRVLRGELPPPPGKALWEWVFGESYDSLAI